MKNRHSARTHRQLVPTDARADRESGAFAFQIITAQPASSAGSDSSVLHSAETQLARPPSVFEPVPDWIKRRVLLLNATYEPLTALPARRAIVLMACGKADTVHEDPLAPVVHSAEWSLQVPAVIRLRNYVRVPYRARVPMTRAALMHRDRFRCGYCGAKAETIDHVVPRSRGGEHSWENCVACCAPCNHRKADKLVSELGWTLRSALVPPSGPHWRLLAATKELHPTWAQYLGEGAA
ncbi:5-methylcytosine-specific restriction endonuclease McrA [Rhodococcus triatomae]|uniref:5-methylcytosine-specific restriction endonuclease McrA n=1 Tax=Rhodococcus triatomae TaxID=300028 RepID=A0A1G8DU56_9NOCA|nr:HNH endonuclease [Rhodococcus triatomae]SDH61236.1 5-methylcytosine-specific restriction endonuclease McrA [Rhodococcus triatomae]